MFYLKTGLLFCHILILLNNLSNTYNKLIFYTKNVSLLLITEKKYKHE